MERVIRGRKRKQENFRIVTFFLLACMTFFLNALPAQAVMIDKAGNGDIQPQISTEKGQKAPAGIGIQKRDFVQLEKNYKEGELLVKFKSKASAAGINHIHKKHGSKKIKEFSSLRLHHVKLKNGLSIKDAIEEYKKDPDVEYAEPNYTVQALAIPNDTYFDYLWNMYNTGQTGGTPGADIHAPAAWDITKGSKDVVVAVIDTGVDYTHEDIAANMWVNTGETSANGADDDGNGYTDDVYGINAITGSGNPMDDFGHGTHCAGTIGAAGNNTIGVAGVSWNVKIMACKFLDQNGSGYISDAVTCMEYVKAMKDKGVNIIATSNSWGGGGYSQAFYDAIYTHMQSGILFIAAAGNSNSNNDSYDNYPSNYGVPNVIAVAATDHNDARASFSSYGRHTVHVGAPGVDIVSLRANGTDMYGDGAHFIPDGDPNPKYYRSSGTSMATPHVTGLAALIKSGDLNRDWRAVKNLIFSGGDNIQSMNGVTITGKRIDAFGSLACSNSPVFSVLQFQPDAQGNMILSALSINCVQPAGPVTVTTGSGQVITLADDGVAPDLAAGDGIFTGTCTNSSGQFTFSSPSGTETVTVPLQIITTSLPSGETGAPYHATLSAMGGVPPYTWSISSGSLPVGLSLNAATGEISGTATGSGTYSVSFTVKDSVLSSATQIFYLTIIPLSVATKYIPSGTLAFVYSQTLVGASGVPPYTWSISAGALPPGLVLNSSTGEISGTPTTTGSYTFTVQIMDTIKGTGTKSFTLPIDDFVVEEWAKFYDSGYTDRALALTVDASGNVYVAGESWPGSGDNLYYDAVVIKYDPSGNIVWKTTYDSGLDDGATGIVLDSDGNVYVASRTASCGESCDYWGSLIKFDPQGKLAWVKTLDSKPGGIAVDGYGEISVTFGGFVSKYDSSGNQLWSRNLNSIQGCSAITADSLGNVYAAGYEDDGYFGVKFLLVKYDRSGNLLWTQKYGDGGSDIASGIALDGNGNIILTGSSRIVTNHAYYTIKFDPSGNVAWSRHDSLSQYSDDYARGVAVDVSGNVYVTGASLNISEYHFVTRKYDSSGNLIWTKQTGGDTGGLDPGGVVVDANGNVYVAGTFIGDWLTIKYKQQGPLKFITAALPSGAPGAAYNQAPTVIGGTTPYTWSVASGSLPPGLTLNSSTGVISGTPTTAGTYSFTIQVMDALSAKATRTFSVPIYYPLVITAASLPGGTAGTTYTQTLAATGGKTPYAWSVSSGSLPTGLTLNGSTGAISGTPTVAGSYTFTVQVTDAIPVTATKQYSVTIQFGITTTSLASGNAWYAYSQTLTASGGVLPYTWSIISGSLPAGLSLNSSTGEISGTPTVPGTSNLTVQVTDAQSVGVSKALSITITYIDLIVTSMSPPAVAGAGMQVQISSLTTNTGTGVAYGFTTKYYLSKDTVLDATDILLGSRSIASLTAGAYNYGTISVTIPADTAWGTYYVIGKADADNTVVETNENNNTMCSAAMKVGADLTISVLTVPATGGAGKTIYITDTTVDSGNSVGPTNTSFYLSTDTVLSGDDTYLGTRAVGALSGGGLSSGSTVLTIPAGTVTGSYYIIAKADSENVVAEVDETNNTKTGPITIGPDLVISGLTVPTTGKIGSAISITDATKNSGAGDAGTSKTSIYLSKNNTLDSSDVFLGSRAVPSLAAGAFSQATTSVTIPAGTTSGTYYIIIKADDANAVAEVNETNNTSYKTISITR